MCLLSNYLLSKQPNGQKLLPLPTARCYFQSFEGESKNEAVTPKHAKYFLWSFIWLVLWNLCYEIPHTTTIKGHFSHDHRHTGTWHTSSIYFAVILTVFLLSSDNSQ